MTDLNTLTNNCAYIAVDKLAGCYPDINMSGLDMLSWVMARFDFEDTPTIQVGPDMIDRYFMDNFAAWGLKIAAITITNLSYDPVAGVRYEITDHRYLGAQDGQIVDEYFVLVNTQDADGLVGPGHYYLLGNPALRADDCAILVNVLKECSSLAAFEL